MPGTGTVAALSTAVPPKQAAARGQFALGITKGWTLTGGQGHGQASPHRGGHTGPGMGHGRASEEET